MDRGGLTTNQHEWDRTLTAELVDYSRENEAATLSSLDVAARDRPWQIAVRGRDAP